MSARHSQLVPMIRQRSLKSPIRASGIGLHGGRKVYISILPAPVRALTATSKGSVPSWGPN